VRSPKYNILRLFAFNEEACLFLIDIVRVLLLFLNQTWIKNKKMKVAQTKKHLGESMALSAVLVATSVGVFILMMMQSGALQ
jgi:hypothetical protein